MNSEAAQVTHKALIEAGINFVVCMPDSAFKELYEPLSKDPNLTYVQVANESDGVGICMGAWLGGLKPVLVMENSGFALTCYALLRGPIAFGVPVLLLISYRGHFGDQRWFSVPFGWGTEPLLEALRVSFRVVSEADDIRRAIVGAVQSMNSFQGPVGVVLGGNVVL